MTHPTQQKKLHSSWITALLVGSWLLALIAYFAPWVGRRSAALAWNAHDLFDLLRLLPEIQSGALSVNLQTLRLPLVGLGALLPAILNDHPWPQRLAAAFLGSALILLTLPPYPHIIGAWSTPGWRVPFWWGVDTALITLLGICFPNQLQETRPWIYVAWIALTTIPAAITLNRLLPALSNLHASNISPGWGFWLCIGSMSALALIIWAQAIQDRKGV